MQSEARILELASSASPRPFQSVIFTRNRRVMASANREGVLRIHMVFRHAPDDVLRAIGPALARRKSAAGQEAGERLRGWLASREVVERLTASSRRRSTPAPRPGDRAHLDRLRAEFRAVNAEHFGGRLPEVSLRLCGRMSRRNGHFSSHPLEIAISRKLCEAAEAGEAERTLRHEMIHLWQWLEGRKPGHGRDFRRWAERLEIRPRATRTVAWCDA